jgi:hypothetical protein
LLTSQTEREKRCVLHWTKLEALQTLDNTVQKVAEGYGADHVTTGA